MTPLLILSVLLFMSGLQTGSTDSVTPTVEIEIFTPIVEMGLPSTTASAEPADTTPGMLIETPPPPPPPPQMLGLPFFPVGPDAKTMGTYDGNYQEIRPAEPVLYAGQRFSQFNLSMDGYIAFFVPNWDDEIPNPNLGLNLIAPMWTDLDSDEGGLWTYEEATNGSLLELATDEINSMFSDADFNASYVFVSTWNRVPTEYGNGDASLQVVLTTDGNQKTYIIMNYGAIPDMDPFFWVAGYGMQDQDFNSIMLSRSSDFNSTSNVNVTGRWAFDVSQGAPVFDVPRIFYSFFSGTQFDLNADVEESPEVSFPSSFQFFDQALSSVIVDEEGLLTFPGLMDENTATQNESSNLMAPLWGEIETDNNSLISYEVVTQGFRLNRASNEISMMFPGYPFRATWLFMATWYKVMFENSTQSMSFQVIMASDDSGFSYVMVNYDNIEPTDEEWKVGYTTADGLFTYWFNESLPILSSESNVGMPGRWVFLVAGQQQTPCGDFMCTPDEQCMFVNGMLGCGCPDMTNTGLFGAMETCMGSSVTVSLSRCQLFNAGFTADMLHLLDAQCTGMMDQNRVVFSFDGHQCGGFVETNTTHLIFKNNILTGNAVPGVISRTGGLNLNVSCAYPLIQNVSTRPINVNGSVISGEIAAVGTYNVTMVPYYDPYFSYPMLGNLTLMVNQPLYVAVTVEGFQPGDVAAVLDNCWATPVPDRDYYIRWDLIIDDCPNPMDGTVQVMQNGVSSSSMFSFNVFTFTSSSNPTIFLHCQVHLCLPESGTCTQDCSWTAARRRRRSAEHVHDTAAISLKF